MNRLAHAPLDFGVARPSDRARKMITWMILVGVAVTAAIYTPSIIRHRHAAIAKATAWRSDGQPCPTSPPDGLARQATRAFEINNVVFAQATGHVSCDVIHTHGGRGLTFYPACKFISPGVVSVRSSKAQAIFYPGVGRSVTVTVERGKPRCVIETSAQRMGRFFQ